MHIHCLCLSPPLHNTHTQTTMLAPYLPEKSYGANEDEAAKQFDDDDDDDDAFGVIRNCILLVRALDDWDEAYIWILMAGSS